MDIKYSIDLDSTKDVVYSLDVCESDSADILGDYSVSSILVESRVLVVGWNDRVGVVWVFTSVVCVLVKHYWLAWVSPWSVLVEDPKTVSTHRVGNIVSELTKLECNWANVL